MANKTINFIMVNIVYKIDRIMIRLKELELWIRAAATMKEIVRKRMMVEICLFVSQVKV